MLSLETYNGEILVGVKSDFFTQGGVLLYVINVELSESGIQKLDTYQSQSEYMKDFVQLNEMIGQTINIQSEVQPSVQAFDLSSMRLA